MQAIRAASDERDLYALRGLRMEKLRGRRQHQYSLRLNDQWRLVIELAGEASAKKIKVIEIIDYH
jgi:proteic killer suppression protein